MDRAEFDARWRAFEEKCRQCKACALRENATNTVIYRGSRTAPLMIIGEAPGAEEDAVGQPFVGKSGQLLQNLLVAFDIDEKMYHICNIVKCRPPENRRPEREEAAACKKLLAEQFYLVRPKIIVLSGSTAYEAFYDKKPVMRDVRGKWDERNGYYIMTTYHPAYALRNEGMKIPLYEDIAKVRAKMEEIGVVPPLTPISK